MKRLHRLTAVLTILQSKKWVTAAQIAERFGVTERTVYRDIRALEEAGVPLISEAGRGYQILEGYALPPVMFTEKEVNAIITVGKLVGKNSDASLAEDYESALTKLKAILRASQKEKAELLEERMSPSMVRERDAFSSKHLTEIQKAVTNFQALRISYLSLSKEELTQRVIEPQALYFTEKNWILVAWCRLRNDLRDFRLDRIQSLWPLSEKIENRNFSLNEYFQRQGE